MPQLLFLLLLLPLLVIIPAIWYYLIPSSRLALSKISSLTSQNQDPSRQAPGQEPELKGPSSASALFLEKELPPISPRTPRSIPRLDLPPHVRTWTEDDVDDLDSSSGSEAAISSWLNSLPMWKARQFNPNTLSLSVSSEASTRDRLSDSSFDSRKKSMMQVLNEEDLDVGPSTSQRGTMNFQDGKGEFVAIFLDDQNTRPPPMIVSPPVPPRPAPLPPMRRGISDQLPYSNKDIRTEETFKSMPHLPLEIDSPPLRTAPMIGPAPPRRPKPLLSYTETQLSLSGFPLPPEREQKKSLPGLPQVTSPRSPIGRLASFIQRISQESIKIVSPPWRSLKSPQSPSDLEKPYRPYAHANIEAGPDSPTMPSPVARDFKRFSATSNFSPRQDTTYQPDSTVPRVVVRVSSQDTGLSARPASRPPKPTFIPPRPGSSFIPPPRPASTLNSPLVPKSARTPSPQRPQLPSSPVPPLDLSTSSRLPPPSRRPPPLSAIFQPQRSKSTSTSSPIFRRPSAVSPSKSSFRTNKRPSSAVISPTSPISPLHKTPRYSSNTEGTFGHGRQYSDASTTSHHSRSTASIRRIQKQKRQSRSLPPIPIQHTLPPLAFEPFRVEFKKRQRHQYDWLL